MLMKTYNNEYTIIAFSSKENYEHFGVTMLNNK
jgi:hypothetical protein